MNAIEGGLAFIAKSQRSDGGFWEYVWDGEQGKQSKKRYRTTFATSLIAIALHDVPKSRHIRTRCADFLLSQKSSFWSWNYWARSSTQNNTEPYPEDLDDTFLALSALGLRDPSYLPPESLASVANLLFETEVKPGGPYRTWVVEKTADKVWRDVDVAVNANIMYFMRLQGIALPGLDKFIEQAIEKDKLESPYYPPAQPILYYIARAYKGKAQVKLEQLIQAKQTELLGITPHDTALTLASLLRLGVLSEECKMAVEYLKNSQLSDGSWRAGSMCIGPRKNPSCSPALTTALCLEALTMYEDVVKKNQQTPNKEQEKNAEYDTVKEQLVATIGGIEQPDLKHELQNQITKMFAYDKDGQIILLPWFVAKAFKLTLPEKLLQDLAKASMWGWVSYTIYDDFLDGEGRAKALPAAIFAARQVGSVLGATLPNNEDFQADIASIMATMDGASTWEVTHCRGRLEKGRFYINQLPEYGEFTHLAQRSFGHAIAGLGVLYAAADLKDRNRKIKALRQFFSHYIIARQLNDDAHDWEEDLEQGHVNSVGALILRKWLAVSDKHMLEKGVDIKNKKTLQLLLWNEGVIDEVCAHIREHSQAARQALLDVGVEESEAKELVALLHGPESAAQKALKTRDEAITFIEAL